MTAPFWNTKDYGLTPDQLSEKYEGPGAHPAYSQAEWRSHVNDVLTLRGYWDWVAWMLETEEDELSLDNPFNPTRS